MKCSKIHRDRLRKVFQMEADLSMSGPTSETKAPAPKVNSSTEGVLPIHD